MGANLASSMHRQPMMNFPVIPGDARYTHSQVAPQGDYQLVLVPTWVRAEGSTPQRGRQTPIWHAPSQRAFGGGERDTCGQEHDDMQRSDACKRQRIASEPQHEEEVETLRQQLTTLQERLSVVEGAMHNADTHTLTPQEETHGVATQGVDDNITSPMHQGDRDTQIDNSLVA